MPDAIVQAVIVSTRPDPRHRLRQLLTAFQERSVECTHVDTTKEAVALVFRHRNQPQAVILDVAPDDPDRFIERMVVQMRTTLPFIAPVVVANAPTASAVMTAFRAGASDFLDLSTDDLPALGQAIARMAKDFAERNQPRAETAQLKDILGDFLRDLVQTERRSLELEEALAKSSGIHEPEAASYLAENRQPVMLIVSQDRFVSDVMGERLEDSGLATFVFTSGEEALRRAQAMQQHQDPFDIALVDYELGGIDGLAVIVGLRELRPALPAFLVAEGQDSQLGIRAADIGVSGYLEKPLSGLARLVNRLRENAIESVEQSREQHYLVRIRERHQTVLERYKDLSLDDD